MKEINKKRRRSRLQTLGLYLNDKFEIHLVIALALNMLSMVVVVGLFELFKNPIIFYFDIMGILIFSVASTLILESIKVFILRHFIDVLYRTYGILFIGVNMLTFYLTTLIIPDVHFEKNELVSLLVFTLLFSLMKLLLIILYQRVTVKDLKEED